MGGGQRFNIDSICFWNGEDVVPYLEALAEDEVNHIAIDME